MNDMSERQRSAWTWAASLAPAVAVLPAVTVRAGEGGWAAPVLALPLIWAADRLWEQVNARGFCRVLGSRGGCALTIIYIMWAVVLGGVQLRAAVGRVERAVNLPAEPWMLMAGVVLLALYLARGKPAACARWALLALHGVLVGLGAMALLALRQVRGDNLLPVWGEGNELLGAVGVTFAVFCVRVYGGFVPCGSGKRPGTYPVLVCALLSGLLLTVQGNLGTALAAQLEDPLLTLSRNVGVEGAFQRAESLLAALLLLADLALLTLLLWTARSAMKWLWPVAVLAVFAAACLPVSAQQLELVRCQIVPTGNFVVGLVIPLILLAVSRGKDRKAKAHIVPENGENSTY